MPKKPSKPYIGKKPKFLGVILTKTERHVLSKETIHIEYDDGIHTVLRYQIIATVKHARTAPFSIAAFKTEEDAKAWIAWGLTFPND